MEKEKNQIEIEIEDIFLRNYEIETKTEELIQKYEVPNKKIKT